MYYVRAVAVWLLSSIIAGVIATLYACYSFYLNVRDTFTNEY